MGAYVISGKGKMTPEDELEMFLALELTACYLRALIVLDLNVLSCLAQYYIFVTYL